ncbi:MAG: flagellar hook-basal body complex protein [Pseudomonadota bacterium]
MDTTGYIALSRQTGLLDQLQTVANNIANASTAGYRREGVIFAEHIAAVEAQGGSVAFGDARGRRTDFAQAPHKLTGGAFDLALTGDGFFGVETPQGLRLTRAGAFTPDAQGILVAPDGAPLLDTGQAPIVIPDGVGAISVASDGLISVNGAAFAQVGVFMPAQGAELRREGGTRFETLGGVEAVETPQITQGMLESSNVDPVWELTRLIEVQRAYEMSQGLVEREDERIRAAIRTLGEAPR